jgi:hypothetical protein
MSIIKVKRFSNRQSFFVYSENGGLQQAAFLSGGQPAGFLPCVYFEKGVVFRSLLNLLNAGSR